MPTPQSMSAERLADHFVNYLFDTYRASRHVRRVASWIGFILKAIDRIAGTTLRQSRRRQVMFDYKGHRFKVKYHHRVKQRGGIQIVEVLPGTGAPEGKVVIEVASLDEVEHLYATLHASLDHFLRSSRR